MTVGQKVFSGKGAREEAAKALTFAVLSWKEDLTFQPRGEFRGFTILSRGKAVARTAADEQQIPSLFVRGAGTWTAKFNPENPLGTMQSIEHTLRGLDKAAAAEEEQIVRLDKTLAEYQAQANRSFEHAQHLKKLLVRQAELNTALDLDKGERQVVEPAGNTDDVDPDLEPQRSESASAARKRTSTISLRP